MRLGCGAHFLFLGVKCMSEKNKKGKSNAKRTKSTVNRFIDKMPAVLLQSAWVDINKYIQYYINLPVVPDMCSPGFPITLEQATELLKSVDLKILPISMSIYEADVKFRNHQDGQVIAVNCKSGKKVKNGQFIQVKYITQEVINESRHLYEVEELKRKKIEEARKEKEEQDKKAAVQAEADKLKAKEQAEADKAERKKQYEIRKHYRKEIRVAKRTEQINAIKETSSNVVNNLQSTVKKVPAVFKVKPKGDEKA